MCENKAEHGILQMWCNYYEKPITSGHFIYAFRPVIVTDVMSNWPAMNWTADFFKTKYGRTRVTMTTYGVSQPHKMFIIFFQYPDHSQSQIEDGYRKEITFLFSHLLIHFLYSCCGSLAFTIICCIVFTCVVDPWYLQLFADPLPLQLLNLGLYSC